MEGIALGVGAAKKPVAFVGSAVGRLGCVTSRSSTAVSVWVAAGVVDVAVACGVEVMSAVPMGSSVPKDPFVGKPINKHYWEHYENTSQFEGAERIASAFKAGGGAGAAADALERLAR